MSRFFDNRIAAVVLTAVLSAGAASVAVSAHADGLVKWAPNGVPVASSYDDRGSPISVADQAGGVFAVWQQYGMIRAQRLTPGGAVAPGWDVANGKPVCQEPNYGGWMQSTPRAMSDGAGGLFVMWLDQRTDPCYAGCIFDPRTIIVQRLAADGSASPGWPALGVDVGSALGTMNPTPFGVRDVPLALNPVLASDGAGGVLVAWTENNGSYLPPTDQPGVHVQRISVTGERLWGARGRVVHAVKSGLAAYAAVAPDGDGGAVVAWQVQDGSTPTRAQVQHVAADGGGLLAAGGEALDGGASAAQRCAQLVALDHGEVLAVWEEGDPSASSSALFARAITDHGRGHDAVPAPLTSSALPYGGVALLADAKQGAWVGWIDVGDADGRIVRAQHLTKQGEVVPGWPDGGVAASGAFHWTPPSPVLAGDGDRGLYVSWRDDHEPRVNRLTRDGALARGWPEHGLPLTDPQYPDVGLHMVSDGADGAIVLWAQENAYTGNDEVRGQRVGSSIAGLKGAAHRTDDVAIAASLAPRFALGGFAPNPAASTGAIAIGFVLPNGEPATIEVFDLLGRRVVTREVGSLGAGEHRVTLDAAGFHPGVFAIRLRQGDHTLTTRGIVTR